MAWHDGWMVGTTLQFSLHKNTRPMETTHIQLYKYGGYSTIISLCQKILLVCHDKLLPGCIPKHASNLKSLSQMEKVVIINV